jgi:hypothetical protein
MKETFVKEKMKVRLRSPILIEGLPGLGMVGKIATRYLVKQLKAKKFAELYSPHFPYYVLVNRKGSVRLLRGNFYFWRNSSGENDLIFLTGDSQAQTIEGQYEVSSCILDFVCRLGTKLIITLGGYRKEVEDKPMVVAVSTSPEILKRALQSKASVSSSGNPIVGTAGLLLGLARFKNIDALCLLGETRGYLPDPLAAKSVLEVLQAILNIRVDMEDLDKEIERSRQIVAKMREIEQRREEYARRMRKTEEERITYIS